MIGAFTGRSTPAAAAGSCPCSRSLQLDPRSLIPVLMATRQTLPVLPLRGTVIFPGLTAPIAAGRPGTLRAIEAALRGDRLVFAVAQRDNADEPTPEILYSMGVIARIGQIQRGLGGVQLLLQGEQRATAIQYTMTEGYLSAVIVPAEEMSPVDA